MNNKKTAKDLNIEIEDVKPEKKPSKRTKKLKFEDDNETKTKKIISLIFIILSAIFLILLVIIFSIRFISAYKEERNPQDTDIAISKYLMKVENIVNVDDGLHYVNNEYIFKGKNVNNYIVYNEKQYQILKMDKNKNIVIISNELVNQASWGDKTNYSESNIKTFLNTIKLDNKIINSSYCESIMEINNINTCPKFTEEKISIPSLYDYNLSGGENSFLNIGTDWWLSTIIDNKPLFVNQEGKVVSDEITNNSDYTVRTIFAIKGNLIIKSGTGEKENPFILK